MQEQVRMCKNPMVQSLLNKFLMGVFICRTGGTVLYSFQVDPTIKIELISQFIAALQMFGKENVGKMNRIIIEGLDVEMSIVSKHDLIVTLFFRPNMVKDYLNYEALKALDYFYKEFKLPLEQGKTNRQIFKRFDEEMCVLIHDYLIRINILEKNDVNENINKYYKVSKTLL
ncbi:MAG: hypothetical protein ACTSYI_01060 [Promethearchaeota archaeon]